MNKVKPWIFLMIHLLSGFVCAISVAAEPGGYHEQFVVSDARQPETPLDVMPKAGYFSLRNQSQKSAVITGIVSPAFESVELHKSQILDGVASMVIVTDLTLSPGETLNFEPGGLHLMMLKARANYAVGDVYSVTIHFSGHPALTFDMPVVESSSRDLVQAGDAHHDHHHHEHNAHHE